MQMCMYVSGRPDPNSTALAQRGARRHVVEPVATSRALQQALQSTCPKPGAPAPFEWSPTSPAMPLLWTSSRRPPRDPTRRLELEPAAASFVRIPALSAHVWAKFMVWTTAALFGTPHSFAARRYSGALRRFMIPPPRVTQNSELAEFRPEPRTQMLTGDHQIPRLGAAEYCSKSDAIARRMSPFAETSPL